MPLVTKSERKASGWLRFAQRAEDPNCSRVQEGAVRLYPFRPLTLPCRSTRQLVALWAAWASVGNAGIAVCLHNLHFQAKCEESRTDANVSYCIHIGIQEI